MTSDTVGMSGLSANFGSLGLEMLSLSMPLLQIGILYGATIFSIKLGIYYIKKLTMEVTPYTERVRIVDAWRDGKISDAKYDWYVRRFSEEDRSFRKEKLTAAQRDWIDRYGGSTHASKIPWRSDASRVVRPPRGSGRRSGGYRRSGRVGSRRRYRRSN